VPESRPPAALVAELREQLDAASRNSSMPPSTDDLPGRMPMAGQERRSAERAKPDEQPGALGAANRWGEADEVISHFLPGD
jgi:transposase